jgi:hypothetical protein
LAKNMPISSVAAHHDLVISPPLLKEDKVFTSPE